MSLDKQFREALPPNLAIGVRDSDYNRDCCENVQKRYYYTSEEMKRAMVNAAASEIAAKVKKPQYAAIVSAFKHVDHQPRFVTDFPTNGNFAVTVGLTKLPEMGHTGKDLTE